MFDATCTTLKSTPIERSREGRGLLVAALVLLLGLTGCGPIEVKRAPPGSDLDGVTIDGDTLILKVLVDNRNDVPLTLSGAQLKLTLGGIELEPREWPLNLEIAPRGRESLDLRLPASGTALGLLGELDAGDRPSLRYALDGRLQIADSRDARVKRNGFLHPVPGRPGRYR